MKSGSSVLIFSLNKTVFWLIFLLLFAHHAITPYTRNTGQSQSDSQSSCSNAIERVDTGQCVRAWTFCRCTVDVAKMQQRSGRVQKPTQLFISIFWMELLRHQITGGRHQSIVAVNLRPKIFLSRISLVIPCLTFRPIWCFNLMAERRTCCHPENGIHLGLDTERILRDSLRQQSGWRILECN